MPFGEDFAESGTQQQKQHFTSYERDSQTGTDYALNRSYSFGVGRFQSADPFQQSKDASAPQSWNRYGYVMNAPADFIDPMGLMLGFPNQADSCGGGDPVDNGNDDNLIPSCSIEVHDRPIESAPGRIFHLPGARHGYIFFTDQNGAQFFFEGVRLKTTGRLVASETPLEDKALPQDRPAKDRLDSSPKSGADVCTWFVTLEHDVSVVNSAPEMKWRWVGPNSSSVLRYMLESLPDNTWYHLPLMIGYAHHLPGVN